MVKKMWRINTAKDTILAIMKPYQHGIISMILEAKTDGTTSKLHKALNAAKELSSEGIDLEVIDPRTLVPLDKQTLINSVKKTGRVVIASEDCKTGGVAAEIAAILVEEAFDYLDAPIKRVSALDVPIPYSPHLEGLAIPQEQNIIEAVRQIVGK